MFVINIKMVYAEFVAALKRLFFAPCLFVFHRTSVRRLAIYVFVFGILVLFIMHQHCVGV